MHEWRIYGFDSEGDLVDQMRTNDDSDVWAAIHLIRQSHARVVRVEVERDDTIEGVVTF